MAGLTNQVYVRHSDPSAPLIITPFQLSMKNKNIWYMNFISLSKAKKKAKNIPYISATPGMLFHYINLA